MAELELDLNKNSNLNKNENFVLEKVFPGLYNQNFQRSQESKKITLIIIEDNDESNYTLETLKTLYPFEVSEKNLRELTIDNIEGVIDNPIKANDLIFLTEISIAIAYQDENEIVINNEKPNGLQMVFSSPISSFNNNDIDFERLNHPLNTPSPDDDSYKTNDFLLIPGKPRDAADSGHIDFKEQTRIDSRPLDELDHSNRLITSKTDNSPFIISNEDDPWINVTTDDNTPPNNWGMDRINTRKTVYTGENETIAVIDSGLDETHPDFKDTSYTLFSFVEGNTKDIYGHGTHCASIAVGKNGVAPKANLIAIKVLNKSGKGEEFTLLLGILLALKKGAQVINFSIKLKNGNRGLSRDPFDTITKLALEKYNCFIVCAAGNDSRRETVINKICSPADSKDALAISAIDHRDNFYVGSNRAIINQSIGFTAPGVDIFTAQSQQTPNSIYSKYKAMTGTSMAAPFIVGTIALIIDKLNTNDQTKLITYLLIGEILNKISNKNSWDHNNAGNGIPNINNL